MNTELRSKTSFFTKAGKLLKNEKYGAGLIVLIMCVFMTFASGAFLTTSNLLNVLRQGSFYVIATLGMLVVLISGEIDLSVGAIMGLSGLVAALLAQQSVGMNVVLVVIIALACGAAIGALNGFLVGYVGMPAFIVTLGASIAFRGLMTVITSGYPVNNLMKSFNAIGTSYIFGVPVPIYTMIIMCIITWFILNRIRFGRRLAATGDNVQAAIVSGINTKKHKLLAFVICGIFAAAAGVSLCARFSSGQLSLGSGYELYAIAGAVIGGASFGGGKGTVLGVFFGTMVMAVMRNGMDLISVNAYWQQFAQGAIIILAVLLDILRKKAKTGGMKL